MRNICLEKANWRPAKTDSGSSLEHENDHSGSPHRACRLALVLQAFGGIDRTNQPTFLFSPQASTGLAPYAVELADMDGDGDKDLVTSNLVDQEFSTVSVSKNNGNGTFTAPVDYPVGPNPTDLRLADFNGDGKPDVVCLAALSEPNSYVTVLFNNGTGGLINRQDYSVGEGANSGGLDVGDYTGDGIPDFAVASLMTGVYVYRNTGSGTFTQWAHFGSFSDTHPHRFRGF